MKKNAALNFLWFFTALLLAGCATNRVDWNGRIGNYTYDQAVVELGPPDKQTKLTDNQTVAEWISRYNTGGSTVGTVGMGTGFYRGAGGVSVIQTAPNYYESKLILTFSTNHVLTAWSKR